MVKGYLAYCKARIGPVKAVHGNDINKVARILGAEWLVLSEQEKRGWAISGGDVELSQRGKKDTARRGSLGKRRPKVF
jgi:hypothetical protein